MDRRRTIVLALAVVVPAWVAHAETGRLKQGVRALEAMTQGSLVGALQHHEVTREGRGPGPGRRDLLHAIRIAPRQPARALAILRTLERRASRRGAILPADVVGGLRAAALRFAVRRGQTLSPTRISVRALDRAPPGVSEDRLRDYARSYADHMRRFNGSYPNEVLASHPQFKDAIRGQVSYWDLDPGRVEAEVIGLGQGKFLTPAGKVRVYNHYLDAPREAALTAAFGQPTGRIAAEMSSSYRTLVLFPERGVPFLLKFSGAGWYMDSKELTADQVRISVERSLHLRDNPHLIPETAGLILKQPVVNVLYRPLPVPRQGTLAPGDVLLSAHVLNDPAFAKTELGRTIFGRRFTVGGWFKKELAPKLARTVYRAVASSFTHLELHSQNIDVLVGADGKVREVFVKDLLDMMHDPALESASGRRPAAVSILRDREWGNMGEPKARFASTSRFYSTYLGMTSYPAHQWRDSKLHRAVRDELIGLARKELPLDELRAYPEFHTLFGKKREVLDVTIHDLRELLIKSGLAARFRPDDRARPRLLGDDAAGTPILGPRRLQPEQKPPVLTHGQALRELGEMLRLVPPARPWEYGFVGEVPVALHRTRSGVIDDYYFRFE
jgi:hypothetical protein